MNEVNREEVYNFLDNLRDSGITNMFGAVPFISEMFEVSSETAKQLLKSWMETYSERKANTQKRRESEW